MTTAAMPDTPRKRSKRRKIALRIDQYTEVAKVYGWKSNADAARALGVSESQISRIVAGKAYANDEFIAALLDVVPIVGFRRCFEIVRVPEEVTTP
jgi:transcriptional regulator with XRE-family HTH domain